MMIFCVSPFEAEGIQRVALLVLCLQQAEVGLPLVADHLAAGEAADGDDHDGGRVFCALKYHCSLTGCTGAISSIL